MIVSDNNLCKSGAVMGAHLHIFLTLLRCGKNVDNYKLYWFQVECFEVTLAIAPKTTVGPPLRAI
jgi:hypothetical protein